MIGYFIFDNIDTRNYQGIVVSEDEVDSAPERVVDEITIAGRNGTLLLDAKRYENVIHSYDIIVYEEYVDNLIQLRNDLLSKVGYNTLTDSFNPDEKYLAFVSSAFNPSQKRQRNAGSLHVEFMRKPQRFLKSGEVPYDFVTSYQGLTDENSVQLQNESGVDIEGGVGFSNNIVNPTNFEAKPLIHAKGNGIVNLGSQRITISGLASNNTDIYIDCETMEIYTRSGSVISGASSFVSFNTPDFPVIPKGTSGFTYTMDIAEIIPRWWRI